MCLEGEEYWFYKYNECDWDNWGDSTDIEEIRLLLWKKKIINMSYKISEIKAITKIQSITN